MKINKILSIVLALIIVMSACGCVFAEASDSGSSDSGSDGGSSDSSDSGSSDSGGSKTPDSGSSDQKS